mmetsp:Transcript_121196/g.387150  ORF Transcript_121196/g.387150 Transcript_121196/m.387150 type:complete len:213 (+) Transcript_121196:2610-3248(+)
MIGQLAAHESQVASQLRQLLSHACQTHAFREMHHAEFLRQTRGREPRQHPMELRQGVMQHRQARETSVVCIRFCQLQCQQALDIKASLLRGTGIDSKVDVVEQHLNESDKLQEAVRGLQLRTCLSQCPQRVKLGFYFIPQRACQNDQPQAGPHPRQLHQRQDLPFDVPQAGRVTTARCKFHQGLQNLRGRPNHPEALGFLLFHHADRRIQLV